MFLLRASLSNRFTLVALQTSSISTTDSGFHIVFYLQEFFRIFWTLDVSSASEDLKRCSRRTLSSLWNMFFRRDVLRAVRGRDFRVNVALFGTFVGSK